MDDENAAARQDGDGREEAPAEARPGTEAPDVKALETEASQVEAQEAERETDETDVEISGDIGPDANLERPDVGITLHLSRDFPVVGELWSISGEIKNQSSRPIWIVDFTTILAMAPEVFGRATSHVSISAVFPTTRRRSADEVLRIDPQASYSVMWRLDLPRGGYGNVLSLLQHIFQSIKNFIFFNPGRYKLFATVHVWTVKPILSPLGHIANVGQSYPVTVYEDVDVEPSPWVLILGAAIGGILCFLIQALYGSVPFSGSFWDNTKNFAVGITSAILLPAIATILLSRLASSDFLVVIKVKDIWGALATGFVLQWFGYGVITKLIGSLSPY